MDSRLVVPVTGGSRMIVDTTDMMGRVLATSGIWEPHVTVAFKRLLGRGDVCVDVGAHTGYYTLLASKLVGPEGRVYALEPSEWAYGALRANLALNGVSNVVPLRVAAGASDGSARLIEPPPGNAGETSIRREEATEGLGSESGDVFIRTVGSLLDVADAERTRLVKIDVEGYEAEVLRGLEPLFDTARHLTLIVELHPGKVEEAVKLLAAMSSVHGLSAYELVRNPKRDRFARPPPPREVADVNELAELRAHRTVNVLLARGGVPFATR
jgi:FkbM family methyltransferase